jgi:predicted acylesterase/phospholipase RssA
MNPLRSMMAGALNPVAVRTSGVSLRLCMASLESAEVRYVDEAGRLRTASWNRLRLRSAQRRNARHFQSGMAGGRRCPRAIHQSDTIGRQGSFDRTDYLRDVAEARRFEGQAKREFDACNIEHPPVPQPISLIEATMASAAFRCWFAPVALAGEHYVDGGVMLQLPTEAAIRADPTSSSR